MTNPTSCCPSMQALLQLDEAEVSALPKSELRRYFLALQSYVRNPPQRNLITPSSLASKPPIPQSQSPFLLLPPEIRSIIYKNLLSYPADKPIRGPHPRQLQTQIALSRAFDTSILRVNRQICREAIEVFYGNLTVHVTIDYNVWSHKVQRSEFLMTAQATSAMKCFHVNIYLGNEKRRPHKEENEARLAVVTKGVRKLSKWLGRSGTEVESLQISWHEPPRTYTWEQKKLILDELKVLRARAVFIGVLNWNLPCIGRKYQFREKYLTELQRDEGATDIL